MPWQPLGSIYVWCVGHTLYVNVFFRQHVEATYSPWSLDHCNIARKRNITAVNQTVYMPTVLLWELLLLQVQQRKRAETLISCTGSILVYAQQHYSANIYAQFNLGLVTTLITKTMISREKKYSKKVKYIYKVLVCNQTSFWVWAGKVIKLLRYSISTQYSFFYQLQ